MSLNERDTVALKRYIKKYTTILKSNLASEAEIMTGLASIYSEAGIPDKAEEYYRQALYLEPDKPDGMNNLALFLIDNDRKISEGLEIVNKALELNPDNYSYLDCKGWGLYKEGKYKEALVLLEKSWDLKPVYDHELFLHIEEVKKAVAGQKKN